jgi:hypothetical protein
VVKHLGATDATFLPGSSVAPPVQREFNLPAIAAKTAERPLRVASVAPFPAATGPLGRLPLEACRD